MQEMKPWRCHTGKKFPANTARNFAVRFLPPVADMCVWFQPWQHVSNTSTKIMITWLTVSTWAKLHDTNNTSTSSCVRVCGASCRCQVITIIWHSLNCGTGQAYCSPAALLWERHIQFILKRETSCSMGDSENFIETFNLKDERVYECLIKYAMYIAPLR